MLLLYKVMILFCTLLRIRTFFFVFYRTKCQKDKYHFSWRVYIILNSGVWLQMWTRQTINWRKLQWHNSVFDCHILSRPRFGFRMNQVNEINHCFDNVTHYFGPTSFVKQHVTSMFFLSRRGLELTTQFSFKPWEFKT